jgi:acetoacetyl-CoA synthetase
VLQLSVLLSGGCAILYDGAFLYPDATHIPRLLAARGDVMGFGCSPRFLSELERTCKAKGFVPSRDLDLSSLKIITSTGAPLGAANAAFVYNSFAPKAQLSSISGGTDIAAAFVGSAVMTPVYGNLICGKGLGFDIGILDPISGEDIEATGEAGELVCRKPFPTQPLMFWGEAKDRARLHEKYMDSYYRRYPEGSIAGKVWAQGDFILRDKKTGCLDICGRSDGVLNPSGVRFGSAEIYHVSLLCRTRPPTADLARL